MSRICLLVTNLVTCKDAPPSSLAERSWTFAKALVAEKHEVLILETSSLNIEQSTEASAYATVLGISHRILDHVAGQFTRPQLPAISGLRTGYKVASFLKTWKADSVWAIGDTTPLAVITSARSCGLLWTPKHIGILFEYTRPYQRQLSGQFPTLGREDIASDYLEEQAFKESNTLFCTTPDGLNHLGSALSEIKANKLSWTTSIPRDAVISNSASSSAALKTDKSKLSTVTICLPYYEQPKFLLKALESLVSQSVSPSEVIVVNDGSTSKEALAAFAQAEATYKAEGWKFITQPNAGPAAARNKAASEAKSEALIFCDCDNVFHKDMIETFTQALSHSGADCVTCAFEAFREKTDPRSAIDPGYIFTPIGGCLELGFIENSLGDTNFIISKNTFTELGGFPIANKEASEDWQFLLNLLLSGKRLVTVPEVLFDYRLAQVSHARSHTELASATAALKPLLTTLTPALQKLWPHLIGVIRNPRLGQVEAERDAARINIEQTEIARQKAENILSVTVASHEAEIKEWHIQDRIRKANLFLAKTAAEANAAQVKILSDASREQRKKDSYQIRELSHKLNELQYTLEIKNDKIKRLNESFSWKITAPLRSIRRLLLDKKKAAEEISPNNKPIVHTFKYYLDSPRSWLRQIPEVTIRGWCFSETFTPILAIRAQIGGRIYPGYYNLSRPDLLRSFAEFPHCAQSGFKIDALTLEGDKSVSLEVSFDEETWVSFLKISLDPARLSEAVGSYEHWVKTQDSLSMEALRAIAHTSDQLPYKPLISILMPVYNPSDRWLNKAIQSVKNQTYSNWELCIADDASTQNSTLEILKAAVKSDSRIKAIFRTKNGHISEASNTALSLATGEFTALFDHDDELAVHALSAIALQLNKNKALELIYTDEDKIDEQNFRFDPHFKPDWNPDLLTAQNYISHLCILRTQTLKSLGGLRKGFEGSQDWDLMLRLSEHISKDKICHIPRVLYHWRASDGSTALHLGEKNYATEAAYKGLTEHFERLGLSVELKQTVGGHWRVRYTQPKPAPLVSIIIPTRNAEQLVRVCTASIFARTAYKNYEIILVDNRSDDASALAFFKELEASGVQVLLYDAEFNYSAITNFAVKEAKGEILCLLNNDIEILEPSWLDELVAQAIRPEIGAVGTKLYYPDMTLQHAGVITGLGGVAGHAFKGFGKQNPGTPQFRPHLVHNVSAVTAACLVIRKSIFNEAKGFNEKELSVAFNDVDFCLKVQTLGYRNLYTPFAELIHHESASRGHENTPEKVRRFQKEIEAITQAWGDSLLEDPAYNPNLSLDSEDFALAYPPRLKPLNDELTQFIKLNV